MADTKISALTALSTANQTLDVLPIVDNTGPTDKKITVANLKGNDKVVGLQDLWIPAVAFWITTTNPATAVAKTETSTNKLNYQGLGFPGTTGTYDAEFTWTPPRNWDFSTIKVTFIWLCTNASTNSVVWRASGVAFQDNTAIDAAQGTQGTVTDANNGASKVNISGQTGAITIAGTPASGNPVQIRVERQAISGSDNLAFPALLLGIVIEYSITKGTAA